MTAAAGARAPALLLSDITKRYPGVVACDHVTFRVETGSVHALVGENGAGKSTLMHIASGLVPPDAGEVQIRGTVLGKGGAGEALRLGLGMVHQHFMLVPTQTVAENIVLGREPRRGPWFDRRAAEASVAAAAARFGFAVPPGELVENLSVGERQRVEVLKVLHAGAQVLVLDEPTAVLAPQEVDDLFRTLQALAAAGHGIVLISHRLPEVLAIADTITVLRRGRVVASVPRAAATEAALAEAIVGRPLRPATRQPRPIAGPGVLALDAVHSAGTRDALRGVTLEVRGGEILGVAGVEGNGQRALVHAIAGLVPIVAGTVQLEGRSLAGLVPAARRAAGLAWVPDDRLGEGLVPEMRLDENLVLGRQRDRDLGRGPLLDPERVRARAAALVATYDVQPPDLERPAAAFSGGNQQRAILARELAARPRALVLGQPTRGVDVGGIEFIHARILDAAAAGAAILLVSADLVEILALADRIAVLYGGRIAGIMDAADADLERLGLWMTGAAAAAP